MCVCVGGGGGEGVAIILVCPQISNICLFVLRFYGPVKLSQPNGVMSSVVSLPNYTFTG